MSVPENVRSEVREHLWLEADRLNWPALSAKEKSKYYSLWTEQQDVGGRLSNYMDARKVRVYIKDSLLKPYTREISASPKLALRVLGIPETHEVTSTYIKPHGLLLDDSRQIAWSRASEWKATLMALHERGFESGTPHAAVFTEAAARYGMPSQREVVEDAARKLGVARVVWLD